MLNSFEELYIMPVAAVNSFARGLPPRGGVHTHTHTHTYIYIYIYTVVFVVVVSRT